MLELKDISQRKRFRLVPALLITVAIVLGLGYFFLMYQNSTLTTSRRDAPTIYNVKLDGAAMEPNLLKGNTYQFEPLGKYERTAIVWINDPIEGPKVHHVRRIVAIAGDSVQITGGRLVVNNTVVEESYLKPDTRTVGDLPPVVVPTGSIYLLADNRVDGKDSRQWGAIPLSAIRGGLVK